MSPKWTRFSRYFSGAHSRFTSPEYQPAGQFGARPTLARGTQLMVEGVRERVLARVGAVHCSAGPQVECDYCAYCSGRNNANKFLVTATLVLYIGNHLLQIRRLYPDHNDWKDGEPPDWWKQMRSDFTKECDNFQQKYTGDAVFGMGDSNPLYRCINDPPLQLRTGNDDRIDDYVSVIDLRYILRKLASEATVAGNNRCADRLLVGMTYHCIGRGGEIKFQNFNDWNWDPRLKCLDPRWHEIKIIDTYPMPIVPDKQYWETDVYHQLACYFSVEDGLFRSTGQLAAGQLNTLLPSLSNSADSYVTRKISNIIRRSLPRGCPTSLQAGYTARSVRKGSITDLSVHPQMNSLRIAARSGHATGCTIDSYLDKNNPARCLHSAVAAAGWANVDNPIRPYRLEAIGNPEATTKLMRKLFACSVPFFNASGKLHVVLRTCAAAMIMYHPRVSQDLGANAISDKLRKAARAAGIWDERFPNLSPELIVDEWAKLVELDFKQSNRETAPINQDAASISAGVTRIWETCQQMASVLADLKSSHQALVLENASTKARCTHLDNEVSRLEGHLQHANHKLSQLQTPEKADNRKSPPVDDVVTVSPPTEVSAVTESVNTRLQYSATASELSKRKENDGKHTETDRGFAKALIALAKQGVLRLPLYATTLERNYHEGHHLKHCLQLVDFIGCKEDKTTLVKGEVDTERLQAARNIEIAVSNKLLEFEGKDPEIEKKNKRGRTKPTYIGFGGRIQNYKKRILKSGQFEKGTKNFQVPFIEVDALRRQEVAGQPGTPPDTRNVATYFPVIRRSTRSAATAAPAAAKRSAAAAAAKRSAAAPAAAKRRRFEHGQDAEDDAAAAAAGIGQFI